MIPNKKRKRDENESDNPNNLFQVYNYLISEQANPGIPE
jgi:hypothetical protein